MIEFLISYLIGSVLFYLMFICLIEIFSVPLLKQNIFIGLYITVNSCSIGLNYDPIQKLWFLQLLPFASIVFKRCTNEEVELALKARGIK